jgi:hypothetical protein
VSHLTAAGPDEFQLRRAEALDPEAVRDDTYGILRRRLNAALGRHEHAPLDDFFERLYLSELARSLTGDTLAARLTEAQRHVENTIGAFAVFAEGIEKELDERCEKCGVLLTAKQRESGWCARHAS